LRLRRPNGNPALRSGDREDFARESAQKRKQRRAAYMSRTLILLGLILIAAGLLWPWIGWLRLGRLPGDIVVERGNFTVYIPIVTGLLLSAALTLFFWIFGR
jgi:hypothetical protein